MLKSSNHWHPGFCAAIQLEFKENKKDLQYESEHELNKQPLRLDFLVIKKEKMSILKNKIGHIFKKHNILEYKSPGDKLGIDTYYKVNAYACLYKVGAAHENEYEASDITISFVREQYPEKLMTYLKENGCTIREAYPGIYYVEGNVMFATQIVVTGKIGKREHRWLTALTKRISPEDYMELKLHMDRLTERDDRNNADALIEVVSRANEGMLKKWKEDSNMCATIERIFAEEFAEKEEKGIEQGIEQGIKQGIETGAIEMLKAVKLVQRGITTQEELVEQGISPRIAEMVLSQN